MRLDHRKEGHHGVRGRKGDRHREKRYRRHACLLSHVSHIRLCKPLNCSPPGSSLRGILQARTLVWVAMSFSRGSSQPSGDQGSRPGIKPGSLVSSALELGSLPLVPPGKPLIGDRWMEIDLVKSVSSARLGLSCGIWWYFRFGVEWWP